MNKIFATILFFTLSSAQADLRPIKIPEVKEEGPKIAAKKYPIRATFHFHATTYSPNVPTGTFNMSGSFDGAARELSLTGVDWVKRPPNYEMVPLKGKINQEATSFTGRVIFEGCKEFVLKRTTRIGGSPISGKWEGSYICAQGVTGLTLTVR